MDGEKYCNYCEYLKPLAAFYLNGRGKPNADCKVCQTYKGKILRRRRYRRDRVYREKERRRRMEHYRMTRAVKRAAKRAEAAA